MPVEMFTDGLEPDDHEALICRFMDLCKFKDLVSTGTLYFNRADRFPQDDEEGLPPEDYRHVLGLNALDLNDRHKLNHSIASIAQHREGFYINCWYLFDKERPRIWQTYGADGVAIFSRYSRLKAAMENFDGRPHLGLVRYGSKHFTDWNTQRFITTKREQFSSDREVRALLWVPDQYAGINRHFDENNVAHERPLTEPPDRVPRYLRRLVNLPSLVTEVIVSPFAADDTDDTVARWLRDNGCAIPSRRSVHKSFRDLPPDLWKAMTNASDTFPDFLL